MYVDSHWSTVRIGGTLSAETLKILHRRWSVELGIIVELYHEKIVLGSFANSKGPDKLAYPCCLNGVFFFFFCCFFNVFLVSSTGPLLLVYACKTISHSYAPFMNYSLLWL